ncbi:hypothetical protein RJ640_009308 [Escallonia rubra]|uniref:Uncharacterized protein n=1 Tax=Escallonia rubra TaxID=112253 RepID=A0AA88QXF8_9ASTE|nr:hypothetical protein RJ640_009308 [Escallonia rubra]
MDLFRNCLERVEHRLRDAKMIKTMVHEVELCKSINQDEAEAYDATALAAIMDGRVHEMVLLDVTIS